MLFPMELSQVSLIRELSFIVQYGTSGADYVYHSQQWTSKAPIFNFRRYVYHLQNKNFRPIRMSQHKEITSKSSSMEKQFSLEALRVHPLPLLELFLY